MTGMGGGGEDLSVAFEHTTYIFPENTNETVTLVAAGAHTWGSWIELVDNNAVTLSSKFALVPGHLSAFVVETVSVNNQLFMLELAYGDAKTIISPMRIYGGSVPKQETRVYGVMIPAGETVYYRLKCAQPGPNSLTAHIRYHFH